MEGPQTWPISCLVTEHSCGIWAWHLARSIKQPDTHPSFSDLTDLLINVMGIHPVTWSRLSLLEQLVQPGASSPLCLKSLSERTWQSLCEGKSGEIKWILSVAHGIQAVNLVSRHFCAAPHAVHEAGEEKNCKHKH